MNVEELIQFVRQCPVCNNEMAYDQTSIIKNFTNYPNEVFIMHFTCVWNGHFQYESYVCLRESQDTDQIKITSMSMQINMYLASWLDDTKEFCLRDPHWNIVMKKVFPDKSLMDWLLEPYKNFYTKTQTLMLLQ